ncbi:MAG: hypothetical protein E7278_02290 [Lachnospiraceae bacterium]|nr:hypothetical protein [Lachnospiraceae bacterium]
MRNMKKKYLSLNQRQKEIIIELLLSEDKTIILDKNSGDTVYLVQNMFLYQPEQLFIPGFNNEMLLKYVPHPWLLDMFNKEEDLFRSTETD